MQQKTTKLEVLPISKAALEVMRINKNKSCVFPGLTSCKVTYWLPRWIRAAKINKHITFHCFRHTFATLQLSGGTDIYTISNLLGHKNLKSTLNYVKVPDELRRKAIDRITIKLKEGS